MKKTLLLVTGLVCALAISVNAAEGGKKKAKLTDEQKTVQKAMLEKYDANKDGKLDKEEKAKMTKEDKQKYNKAFPSKKKGEKKSESK